MDFRFYFDAETFKAEPAELCVTELVMAIRSVVKPLGLQGAVYLAKQLKKGNYTVVPEYMGLYKPHYRLELKLEALQSFDEMFIGMTSVVFDSVVLNRCSTAQPCQNCSHPTQWINSFNGKPICSPACYRGVRSETIHSKDR